MPHAVFGLRKLKSTIFAIKIRNDKLQESIAQLLQRIMLPKKVENIAIKLNMCDFRLKETGATSDPLVVDALLSALRKIYPNSEIFLLENDATTALADVLFNYLGISEIAKKHRAHTLNLSHDRWTKKEIDGLIFKKIEAPMVLANCDLVITHPKLKTHGKTKITCGLKNMFGCLREKRKIKFHKFLDEAIVDANLAFRANLSIVDANICQEGIRGPAYGTPRKLGLLIGGMDIVAVDTFCARLIGFKPWFIGHIRKAAHKELGKMNYDLKTNISSNDLRTCKLDFSKLEYYFTKLLRKPQ